MLTQEEAEKAGRALLKRMSGKGWKLRVYEKLGWYYCVWKGPAVIFPNTTKGHFCCLLGDKDCGGVGSGVAEWTTKKSWDCPNKALEEEVASAREYVKKKRQALAYVEKELGLNGKSH